MRVQEEIFELVQQFKFQQSSLKKMPFVKLCSNFVCLSGRPVFKYPVVLDTSEI